MCYDFSDGSYSNSIYGNYQCDLSWYLILLVIVVMKRFYLDLDFILWIGLVLECCIYYDFVGCKGKGVQIQLKLID